MKRKKGQSIVEFAIVLPFFLLLLFGIFYSGMLFHDYSTLSNIARSAAREAALDPTKNYSNIITHYQNQEMLTSLYRKDTFEIKKGENDNKDDEVYVKITMRLNVRFPLLDMMLPESFDVVKKKKKDQSTTTTTEG